MEIIVAIMLVSMVVLGIAAGFLGLVRANRMTQEQQAVDHAATNYAESLKSADYLPCGAGTPDYDSSSGLWVSERADLSVQVIDVEYWNPATDDYGSSCPGAGADAGTQRLTIRAEWRDRERQAQIVKRNR
jgi:type II secretory pathway pseudopilin PulG